MGHTDEQQLVIKADGQTILVIALAGTGKTANHDIPGLIELIRRKGKTFENGIEADLILTTAHKSKGLEFENVLLTDDYVSFFDQDGDLRRQMDESEVNLLYVAVTRAEKAIQLNETTLEWLRHIGETLPLKKGSASLWAA